MRGVCCRCFCRGPGEFSACPLSSGYGECVKMTQPAEAFGHSLKSSRGAEGLRDKFREVSRSAQGPG